MIKYLVHAVGMFKDFKHYHISFAEFEYGVDDEHNLTSNITSKWKEDAKTMLSDKVGEMPEDVYIVGFNVLIK